MTGDPLVDNALSLVAIAVVAAVVAALFGFRARPLDLPQAAERLAADEPDFAPADRLLAADGSAALFWSEAGEAALVRRVGGDAAIRRFPVGSPRVRTEGYALIIGAFDLGFGAVRFDRLDPLTAECWARRLGAQR